MNQNEEFQNEKLLISVDMPFKTWLPLQRHMSYQYNTPPSCKPEGKENVFAKIKIRITSSFLMRPPLREFEKKIKNFG